MTIYFRSKCKAIQTEYWHIEAPAGWDQMSEADRLAWLDENIGSAHFDSTEDHLAVNRIILDYQVS